MSLIERLRSEAALLDQLARTLTRGKSQVSQAGDACREAAATLEAQQAQIAELTRSLENKAAELESLQEAVRDAGFKTEWVARK